MIQKKLATFRIDADQWDAFQEWAKRSGTNASALLVNYIEQCLDRTPSRFSHFPDRMNKNLDKRLDSLEQSYHAWLDEHHQQQAFERLLNNPKRPIAPMNNSQSELIAPS